LNIQVGYFKVFPGWGSNPGSFGCFHFNFSLLTWPFKSDLSSTQSVIKVIVMTVMNLVTPTLVKLYQPTPNFFNEFSSLATTLGVTKFLIFIAKNFVTLYCDA
jgi:hypothetical protein